KILSFVVLTLAGTISIFLTMRIQGKVVVVTGGANGIGRALCHAFAAAGARAVVVSDIDVPGTNRVAEEVKGLAVPANVGREDDIRQLVEKATKQFGQVDIFC